MSVFEAIATGPGYYVGQRLSPVELKTVRGWITAHYLDHLQSVDAGLVNEAERLGIENYHLLKHSFEHGTVWPKQTRILSTSHVGAIRNMGFSQALLEEFGDFGISDDELNWRLVRPHADDDVGPVHADGWFWELGYGRIPPGWDRFKIWVPIYSEVGANGLSVKPYSHLRRDWKRHAEVRHGMAKPVLDENVDELNMQLLPLEPGAMVMFHDALLHGGVVNRGTRCRVSLELTIFYRSDFQMLRSRQSA
jgi:hypothetical protein